MSLVDFCFVDMAEFVLSKANMCFSPFFKAINQLAMIATFLEALLKY